MENYLFFDTKETFLSTILTITALIQIIILNHRIYDGHSGWQLIPLLVFIIFYLFYKLKLFKKKKGIFVLFEIITFISLVNLSIFIWIYIDYLIGYKLVKVFAYKEIIYYSVVAFICGNTLNFGSYFIELLYKPIEKEYIFNKDNPKHYRSITSLHTTIPTKSGLLNISSEPLIPAAINKTFN